MAQNLTAHNFDWLTFTRQSLSGSGDRAPLSCIILMMIGVLGINRLVRGFDTKHSTELLRRPYQHMHHLG